MDYEFTHKAQKAHYSKNRNNVQLTPAEISRSADELVIIPCDHKNIEGYVTQDEKGNPAYVKYNKSNEVFVVYDSNRKVIYKTTKTWREYQGDIYTDDKFPFLDTMDRDM